MKSLLTALSIPFIAFFLPQDSFAQREVSGKMQVQSVSPSSPRRTLDPYGVTPPVGPVYPPPKGANFTISGFPNDGLMGRASGKDYWFSGVKLASQTTVYWGPVNGDVRLSMDGATFTSAETLQYSGSPTLLVSGIAVWSGSSFYYPKGGGGPVSCITGFTMTVTDSTTGNPISLTAAAGVGLPPKVGAVVPVTAGLHFHVNFKFLINGVTPHLDFFDANADSAGGQAYSSFGSGFYYTNIPPTISSISSQSTLENTPAGPFPFTIHSAIQPATALITTAHSSNQALVTDAGIVMGGTDTSRSITLTPATNQTGSTTVTIKVSDGTDSATTSFNLTVNPPVQFQVAPPSLNFGNVLVGSQRNDSVIASNPGAGTVHVSSAISNNTRFTVIPTADSIPGSGNKKFYITYSPNAPGPDSGKIYFTHDAPTSPDSVKVKGQGVLEIIVSKRVDADGDTLTTGDQTSKSWHLSLYALSVTPGNLVAQGDVTDLIVNGLQPGVYIAVEADSGAAWHRINGNRTLQDTVTLSAAPVTTIHFINFRPNSLTVSKLRDNDGNFITSGDRVAIPWHLEIHRDSANGPLVVQGAGPSISDSNLQDGTYYAKEADSLNWLHLGYVDDGIPISSPGTGVVTIILVGGHHGTIDFVNAPPVYSEYFRTFREDSLALDKDYAGKLGKPVKRKAKFVDFAFDLIAPQTVSVTLKFSILSSGVVVDGPDTVASWTNAKLVTTPAITNGATIHVTGRGFKGALMKATFVWATLPQATKGPVLITTNILRLPMPDRVNALFETYNASGFSATGGMLVGKVHSDSAKSYGWVLHKKYTDVLKSLYDKKSAPPTHDGPPHGFDFLKAQSKLPKSKSNNVLFADLVALKLNVVASMLGILPVGLGELTYDDGTSNTMNGTLVRNFIPFADSVVMGYYATGVHLFQSPQAFKMLDSAIANINAAFEGPMDTISFGTSLVLKGVRQLAGVPYLHATPGMVPSTLARVDAGLTESPVEYRLLQNFPNPFNPSTTIQFDLPQPSIVTLKIYNMLGQEVATLADNQAMDDGYQEYTFDARNIASGVYFYRLVGTTIPSEDNDQLSKVYTVTRKMLFLK